MTPIAIDEARIFSPDSGSQEALIHLNWGSAAVWVACAPGKEAGNEDVAAIIPTGSGSVVLAIADGCGGHAAGGEAARLAISTILRRVEDSGDDVRSGILHGIDAANEAIAKMGVGAACTVALVEIDGRNARPYHVGDSEVLIVGQRGRRKLQTLSHSPVSYAVEAGLIEEADALHHDERHLVSNHVGSPDMRIEIGPAIELAPRDTVLVASDGLFDNLHADEIVEIIRSGSLEAVAEELARTARQRMTSPTQGQPSKPDDLSFIIFRPAGDDR